MHRHLGLVAQPVVESLQQGAATGKHDPAVHDVRRELGRSAIEGLLDGVDDRLNRLLDRHPDLFAREDNRLREAGDQVAAANLGLHLLLEWEGGPDLELDLLGRLGADHQLVLTLDVVRDRLVDLVAADANRLRDDDAAQRDDSHLGGATADVDDHVAARLTYGQPGADCGGHWLLDQVRLACAGGQTGLFDRALLDPGDARGDADNYARMGPAILVDLLDEVTEHLLSHVEVGDDAVLQRPDRLDRSRRPSQHPL